ncbi:MAG: serine hydrolase [Chloroflexi bacterium]|nr:serine hydrolase [Chloroflexota bacterium]
MDEALVSPARTPSPEAIVAAAPRHAADPGAATPSPDASPSSGSSGTVVATRQPSERPGAATDIERLMAQRLPTGSAVLLDDAGAVVAVWRPDERRVAASTIKLALLLEVLRRDALGLLDLRSPYTVRAADVVGGTGELQKEVGRTLARSEMLRLMVLLSDNVAANVLVRDVGEGDAIAGMARVTALMADRGYVGLRFRRLMLDTAAQARGVENEVTALGLARILDGIRRGTVLADVSPTIAQTSLQLLEER